jgi:hypothetical protein
MKKKDMTREGNTMGSSETAGLPELEAMLTAAAARQVKESGADGFRIAGARASRVAAVGLVCLAFAGTAMAATGVWDPQIGTEASNSPPPSTSTNPVPTDLTDALGTLRRAPDARDRGPEVEKTLGTLGNLFVQGVRPDSVRYIEPWGDHGEAVLLFSAESSVFADTEDPACVAIPSVGGAGAINGEAGVECFELDKILAGKAISASERLPRREGQVVKRGHGEAFGLVPDGVSSITAEFENGFQLDATVADNFFKFGWDPADAGEDEADVNPLKMIGPARIIWRDADGNVVPQQAQGDSASLGGRASGGAVATEHPGG